MVRLWRVAKCFVHGCCGEAAIVCVQENVRGQGSVRMQKITLNLQKYGAAVIETKIAERKLNAGELAHLTRNDVQEPSTKAAAPSQDRERNAGAMV